MAIWNLKVINKKVVEIFVVEAIMFECPFLSAGKCEMCLVDYDEKVLPVTIRMTYLYTNICKCVWGDFLHLKLGCDILAILRLLLSIIKLLFLGHWCLIFIIRDGGQEVVISRL